MSVGPPAKKMKGIGDDEEEEGLYAEDGGLKRQQQKRLKSMMKRKVKGMKKDNEDVSTS